MKASQRRLRVLHDETDRRSNASTAAIGVAIGCAAGCHACCCDGLTVWRPEADAIANYVRTAERVISPGPPGACAFLDPEGHCQVYPARPYVCRSQGAVLRWHDGEGERRATCSVHLQGLDLDGLPVAACFQIGPAEQDLLEIATADLIERSRRGLPERVPLRALAEALQIDLDRAVGDPVKRP